MSARPSLSELIEAVRDFLQSRALPELEGQTAFHARVAVNALSIVAREIAHGAKTENAERLRLTRLLGQKGSRDVLNRELCRRIRAGKVGEETPHLLEHVEKTVRDRVAIDQPDYAGLKRIPAGDPQVP